MPNNRRDGRQRSKRAHTGTDYRIQRSCRQSGKLRYRDKEEADAARRVLERTNEREVSGLRTYECEFCRGWHLTSSRKIEGVKKPPPPSLILKAAKYDRIVEALTAPSSFLEALEEVDRIIAEEDPLGE